MKAKLINWLIRVSKVNTNKIGDGYHTIGELYEHRIALWIAFCRVNRQWAWKSMLHSDGTCFEGWFVLGLYKKSGEQITYHLPFTYWPILMDIKTLKKAPKWDGHTNKDVINRLNTLCSR